MCNLVDQMFMRGGFKPEMFVSSNQEHLDVVQAWKSSKKASVRNHSMAQDFYRI